MAILARVRTPLILFVVFSGVYLACLGDRISGPSADNHFAHLAESFLNGQLGAIDNRPDGTNDWACYDTVEHAPCPNNRFSFPDQERYRWYISFPPLPAVVMMPAVAIWGVDMPDRAFWAFLAGLGPALLFVLLRFLRESGRSIRKPREDVLLSVLFAFGTVYFYTSVQGTVWFAAHVVAVPLLVLYVLFSIDARKPLLAGLMLGLAFMTRPTTAFLVVLFWVEVMGAHRSGEILAEWSPLKKLSHWFRGIDYRAIIKPCALFAAPILMIGAIAMYMNEVRFEDPFEFGHSYLQIRWRPRVERWGLFNYHFLPKNMAVFFAGMPWLSARVPHLTISRHGLALWFTTPGLLWALWPKKNSRLMVGLALAAILVAVLDLMYQNSGWIQFGYRFALDYLVLVFALIALGGRKLGLGFWLAMVFAIIVNTFGAITFDRMGHYYDNDDTQERMFQPDE